ncbi:MULTISPECIES: hypothetical protein [Bacillaceae]|uniref:Uncharacterized protein n=1 Tax=Evansella alkalicola TaxID=745819 RepID=A0ABS6JZQ3_9BACI|nr:MULTISPECIES: hypothetical protein [Bacillaceae]MBU9724078.1 hypothetical protein [Bacillus alkalicola]
MDQSIQQESIHNLVLLLIVEILAQYERNAWPSPTIRDLSLKIGYPEETILESIELGRLEPVSLLQ